MKILFIALFIIIGFNHYDKYIKNRKKNNEEIINETEQLSNDQCDEESTGAEAEIDIEASADEDSTK